jgi:hypothetical protein
MEWTSGTNPFFSGMTQFYDVFPDPNATTVDGVYEETGSTSSTLLGGQLVAYAGRILRLCETSQGFGTSANMLINDKVRYTDPPNSVSLTSTSTDTFIDEQTPGGIGAWGTLSFGELFLVKKQGGALLIEGDIYSPSITRLPGVKSTGNMVAPACSTPAGMLYAVQQDGIYLWNGGSDSTKINKVDDNLFVDSSGNTKWGVTTDMAFWQNIVVFRNGLVYDPLNDSWWNLPQVPFIANTPIQWLAPSLTDTSVLWILGNGTLAAGALEVGRLFPGPTAPKLGGGFQDAPYLWTSQPIPASVDHKIRVSEVIITVSNILNHNQSINAIMQTIDGNSSSETFNFNVADGSIQSSRKTMSIEGNCIQICLIVNNVHAENLIINSIAIGWQETTPYGQTG